MLYNGSQVHRTGLNSDLLMSTVVRSYSGINGLLLLLNINIFKNKY